MSCAIHDSVRRFLLAHTLPANATIIAAVSGGVDSLTLLYTLAELRGEFAFKLRSATLHHGMRAEADDDIVRLREHCDNLGVPLDAGYADVPGIADRESLSLEVAGRQARYDFLYATAAMHDAHAVCTGHTSDDQAETLLLRISAGTGLEGLGGIAPARMAHPPESPSDVWLWRPLLNVTRMETTSFCAARGFSVLEDPANFDARYPRNRVRHTLLPLLEREFNPAIRDTLGKLADIAREDEAVLAEMAQNVCAIDASDGACRVSIAELTALPLALQRRVARRILRAVGGTGKALAFDNVERFLWAVRTNQRECHLHGALSLKCKAGTAALGPIGSD